MENKIKNNSGDKKYYITVPKLVWMKARDSFDLTFWTVIKDIAGEDSECRITTKELAILCMMSIGKVSECRSFWLKTGLIDGQREKEPSERNAVWHLTIPDFWEENIKQAKLYHRVKDRVKLKKEQQLEIKRTVSCGETVTVSCGEKGSSPHEKDYPPHETAYLYREKPLEEPEEYPAPQNGAVKNIPIEKIESHEPGNFEKLIDWWYKCKGEENPGTEPPRYKGKRFTEIVSERLSEKHTWKEFSASMKVYWMVVNSADYYYNYKGTISWFMMKGIDEFWNPTEALDNFRDRKNGNGTNGKATHKVTPAASNLYFKEPEKKVLSAEDREAENEKLKAIIGGIRKKIEEPKNAELAV